MEIIVDTLILLILLQTVLKLSLWPRWWPRLVFVLLTGGIIWLSADYAASMSKPQIEAWLHDSSALQNVAVVCLIDALLSRLRCYPGLLILPAALLLLARLFFTLTGADFHHVALLLAVAVILSLLLLPVGLTRILPQNGHRTSLHLLITVLLCVVTLLATQQSVTVYPMTSQNIIMEYISKALFGIANLLLIPDVILLILFFVRSILLLFTTYVQYSARRSSGHTPLYAKYSQLLTQHTPDEAYADYLVAQMEAEAAKDVNLSRLLTKLGPVLGLIGTLISMSPALVGLSNGDISGMAYNMQVVFSATVVGLVISVVGLFTQQLKSRWYALDVSTLEYESLIMQHHEKEV